ncbi:MAG TPA: hypothetical protein VFE58_15740 [Tepidisphaeraceae bacterium]|jgi:hypothetical protein|nr:hypothetical protein [Tepidisphaeraceae bacterium]
MPRPCSLAILAIFLLAIASPTRAALFGVQIDTGNIVEINPASGEILRSFPAPDSNRLSPHLGLSGAENGSVLLWMDPAGETTLDLVTRIDPITGAVLDYHLPPYLSTIDGLSSQRIDGVDYIIVGGRSDGILVQHGYDSDNITYFTLGVGANVLALGGRWL